MHYCASRGKNTVIQNKRYWDEGTSQKVAELTLQTSAGRCLYCSNNAVIVIEAFCILLAAILRRMYSLQVSCTHLLNTNVSISILLVAS